MKSRHVHSTAGSKTRFTGTVRRVMVAALSFAALMLALYGYVHFEAGTDADQSVAACRECADSVARLDDEARGLAPAESRASNGTASRIFSAIRGIFNVLDTAWRKVGRAEDGVPGSVDAECEPGMVGSLRRCTNSGAGIYMGWKAGSGAGAPSGAVASISGRVMDVSGFGIEGIPVSAVAIRSLGEPGKPGTGAANRWTTKTDVSGFYQLRGLPEGDYEVRTAASGSYGPGRLGTRSGVRNADILLVAARTVVIEGEVVGVAGERMESVTVLPVVVGVPSVKTDPLGGYRLEVPLQPETRSFLVRFQLPGFLESSIPIDLTARPAGSIRVNVKMQPIEAWTSVSGVVKSAAGSPLKGRSVSLRRVGGQTAYTTKTDGRGRYSFDAVEAPVTYHLSVSGAPDHQDYRQKVDVATNSTRFDVVAKPFEFGTISGRLVSADGSPVSNLDLVLRNMASQSANAVISSDAYGNFQVAQAPAGELTIASQSSPSILARGLRLAPGEELDVALVLDWGAHELSGLVVDSDGNPVPAAKVLLTWSHLDGAITTSTIRRSRSDAQGVFSFSQLGPGPHVLQIELPGRRPVQQIHDVTREGYFVKVTV